MIFLKPHAFSFHKPAVVTAFTVVELLCSLCSHPDLKMDFILIFLVAIQNSVHEFGAFHFPDPAEDVFNELGLLAFFFYSIPYSCELPTRQHSASTLVLYTMDVT